VTVPRLLQDVGQPVVLLNCYSEDAALPSVVPGEVAAVHRATDVLIKAGHRRIATITGGIWMEATTDRLNGYRRALATADTPYDPKLVREGNWQVNSGYEQTHRLLELARPPTAIFCMSDRMAVGCYNALHERGLVVPRDVSVIGFDNEEVSQHLTPQLTTLELPQREMGRWAVELIRGDAEAGLPHRIVKLECPLIERASLAEAPRSSFTLRHKL
jgi:LacI family transcriptional regulator